jgi:hypothetical protein
MFDGDDVAPNIRTEHMGSYVAISYITNAGGAPSTTYKLGNSWIQSHGLEHVDLEVAIPYLAKLGCGPIWLDVVSAPRPANMTKVQRTYECASVVYGVLNRDDSKHFWRVLNTMRVLQQTFEQPQKGLPPSYLAKQRLSPSSRDYYKNVHTYWTRIWPFAELAVAENFTYVVRNSMDGYEKVSLQQLRNELVLLESTYATSSIHTLKLPIALENLIERDVSATKIHVLRFVLRKTGAATDAERLMVELIPAPRHALDWDSMMGAVSIFDPRMKVEQNNAVLRLKHIAAALSDSGIVNQPTLGLYKSKTIQSSFLPPTNRAKWSNDAFEFVGGGSVTTALLTRLGRVIGRHNRTDSSKFPEDWELSDAYLLQDKIYMECYVGPLSQTMALAILKASSSTGSGSSISSQHDMSMASYLVANLPQQLICYVAVRGDRYAYILDNRKRHIVGYVGYGFLGDLTLRDYKLERLIIHSTLA